jgi:long-chain acyl-CoA synthetase
VTPTAGGGVQLHAFLVPAGPQASAVDLAALVAECNGRLAVHQRLASASWYPETDFPRTSMLKLRRHLLPKPDEAAVQVESTLAADDPVGQAVAGVARVDTVGPDQTLGQLGLDSLGLVELAAALETKTGKLVAEGDLRLELNVEQIRALLALAPALESGSDGTVAGPEETTTELPDWPYTWGRLLRVLDFPVDLLYRGTITRTVVLGRQHLAGLPTRVIFAGTHHGFPDMPLVHYALAHSGARHLANRLLVAVAAGGFGGSGVRLAHGLGPLPWYGIISMGLYPLRQLAEQEVSLRGLVRLAQRGNPVLIFPQGTHASPEEERQGDPGVRFRPGVAHLAKALGAIVVPFGLAGTEAIMPADPRRFTGPKIAGVPLALRRGPLAIAFGPPLQLGPDESPQAFTTRLQAISYALTRQAEQALEGSYQEPERSTSAAG